MEGLRLRSVIVVAAMNIRQVAALARLELSDEEAGRYQAQVDQILHYVEQLNAIE